MAAGTPLVRGVVLVEVLLALGLTIWAVGGAHLGVAALAIAAAVALLMIPWREHTSPLQRIGRRCAFGWARVRRRTDEVTPAPFDIPTRAVVRSRGADVEEPPIGARWAGDTLITALRVRPGTPVLTRLGVPGSDRSDAADAHVPLDVLVECIDPFDIPLASIDVVSQGTRIRGRGTAASTYLRTLGRLTATAHRNVFVILRLDPRDCPDAVARRGGGAEGALRAATITTKRVARRLTERGLTVAALSAAEMTAVTDHLAAGHELDELTEEWDGLRSSRLSTRSLAVDPDELPRVAADIWAQPSAATTLTVRLGRGTDGRLRVAALVRLDGGPADGGPNGSGPNSGDPTGTVPLRGRQFDAFTTSLPVASPPRLARALPAAEGARATRLVEHLALPAGGCGQLLGADPSGHAVAVPLVGPGIEMVILSGTYAMIAQTVLRTVAIGAPVVLHTSAPQRWHHLVAAVADPPMLHIALSDNAPRGMRVDLYDGVDPPAGPPPPGTTRFVIDDGTRRLGSVATISLIQNPHVPQQISVLTPNSRTTVTMVALPEEWAMIGEAAARNGAAARSEPAPVGRV
ncbi:type VII secretion protein EccE [Gordonia sp. L191]|uniref:type VII secretion protein EccE n=1 Tax=Gordonia sp. L191 TaxID=2982699 RepID=UPI0024C00A61|nr:type VII secretion protein EccE [Gordonia sp. L191]WHU48757.1 type VII secretion protein EccE [Gordonia sp. L191]